MPEFIHLHSHTHYSLLDGACSVDGLIEAAVKNKMPAVALTDHGVNFGLLEFYQKAKKAGIKPILGCEVYMTDGDRFDKSSLKSGGKLRRRNYFHLLLLAKNHDGYRTLNKLTSRAYTGGFYYKPRIDRELRAEHREGPVRLSACALRQPAFDAVDPVDPELPVHRPRSVPGNHDRCVAQDRNGRHERRLEG